MDPVVIKKWLVGSGKYFGANEAHEFRWADAKARPEVRYFTYVIKDGSPDKPDCRFRKDEISGTYDVVESGEQHWTITVEINLYNDREGFDDLAGCGIAAGGQTFKSLFQKNNIAFKKTLRIRDMSEETDDRMYYRQQMICEFTTWMGYRHERQNEVITTVVTDGLITEG